MRKVGAMFTVVLLFLSNVFMTFAWYGHLRFGKDKPLMLVIGASWGIAFFEYLLMIPANRLGASLYKMSAFQLKITQEVITILVFLGFAVFVLNEKIKWNYVVSFGLILLAGYFAFGFPGSEADTSP